MSELLELEKKRALEESLRDTIRKMLGNLEGDQLFIGEKNLSKKLNLEPEITNQLILKAIKDISYSFPDYKVETGALHPYDGGGSFIRLRKKS